MSFLRSLEMSPAMAGLRALLSIGGHSGSRDHGRLPTVGVGAQRGLGCQGHRGRGVRHTERASGAEWSRSDRSPPTWDTPFCVHPSPTRALGTELL